MAVTRRGIAIHEAGHAVASAVFKRPFSFVTIERFGRLLGHLELRGEPLPPSEEAIATWAGSVAQALLAASNVEHTANRGDYAYIERLANTIAGNDKRLVRALMDAWHNRAMSLVTEHAAAIERVAAALIARTTLTEADVIACMA